MYMSGLIANKKCHLYRIDGVDDHIHMLTHLNPAISLSALAKDIKLSSGEFIRTSQLFPSFRGWQEGYGAFTYSFDQKTTLIKYVMNQEIHHRTRTFREEYIELLQEHDVEFEEKYLV
jgi:putative transposase